MDELLCGSCPIHKLSKMCETNTMNCTDFQISAVENLKCVKVIHLRGISASEVFALLQTCYCLWLLFLLDFQKYV